MAHVRFRDQPGSGSYCPLPPSLSLSHSLSFAWSIFNLLASRWARRCFIVLWLIALASRSDFRLPKLCIEFVCRPRGGEGGGGKRGTMAWRHGGMVAWWHGGLVAWLCLPAVAVAAFAFLRCNLTISSQNCFGVCGHVRLWHVAHTPSSTPPFSLSLSFYVCVCLRFIKSGRFANFCLHESQGN